MSSTPVSTARLLTPERHGFRIGPAQGVGDRSAEDVLGVADGAGPVDTRRRLQEPGGAGRGVVGGQIDLMQLVRAARLERIGKLGLPGQSQVDQDEQA